MTARELKQQVINCFIAESGIEYPAGSIGWQMKQNRIEILYRFIDQLCKEQRSECGRIYEFESMDTDVGMYPAIRESIENANMPEL